MADFEAEIEIRDFQNTTQKFLTTQVQCLVQFSACYKLNSRRLGRLFDAVDQK